jgi:NAD(P)-dependent dehydrogenase (short-subunit alcohol dehydrogenase family)
VQIEGTVALVTGAGSGIGRATAAALASEGASVVIADIDESGGRETVQRIDEAGGMATFFRVDVTDAAQVQSMIAAAEEAYGGLDIVHNNAGIIASTRHLQDSDLDAWLRMVQINFIGVLLGTQAAIPALQRRGGGVIVQTASIAGLIPYPGNPVYAATKSGVVGFTRSLYHLKDELNIRVNCVCPERVDTALLRGARVAAQREQTSAAPSQQPAVPVMPPEHVAAGVLQLVRDDELAGAVMKISPDQPPEILSGFPDWGVSRPV